MSKATITLELSYEHIAKVMGFIHNLSAPPTASTTANLSTQDKVRHTIKEVSIGSVVVPITANKKTKMPALGRSQEQIDSFTEEEQLKFNNKTEAQLLREEREQGRLLKKAAKDLITTSKKEDAKKIQDEVDAIKSINDEIKIPSLPAKPWEL